MRDESLTATTRVFGAAATLPSKPDHRVVDAHGSASDEEVLTVHGAARFLNVSVSWVYEHVRPEAQDRLPGVKLGKYLRFDARDLRAYVDAKRAELTRVRTRR